MPKPKVTIKEVDFLLDQLIGVLQQFKEVINELDIVERPKNAVIFSKVSTGNKLSKAQLKFKIHIDVRNHFNEQQLYNHIKRDIENIIKKRKQDPVYLPKVNLQSYEVIRAEVFKSDDPFYKSILSYNLDEERKISKKAETVFKRAAAKLNN